MRDLRLLLRPRLAANWRGWTSVVLLLAGSASAAYQSGKTVGSLDDVMAQRMQAEAIKTKTARTITRLTPDQARHWQMLGAEIAYPWEDLFQAVERTATNDIELLEMTPDKLRRQMVLRGEARDNSALVKYVQKLAAQPSLHDVFVARMQSVERGSLLTVEFEIRMGLI